MRGLALALLFAATAANAAPPPGRYAATLCVSTSPAAPASCGAAEFDVRSSSQAQVRVADVVYRLHLLPAQVDVTTMQGTMDIDEFSAPYKWLDNVLVMTDTDKHVRYEIKVGAKAGSKR